MIQTEDDGAGGVHYRLVWEDGSVSRGSMERSQLQRDPAEGLAPFRARGQKQIFVKASGDPDADIALLRSFGAALEPGERDTMRRPPFPPSRPILDRFLIRDIAWIASKRLFTPGSPCSYLAMRP